MTDDQPDQPKSADQVVELTPQEFIGLELAIVEKGDKDYPSDGDGPIVIPRNANEPEDGVAPSQARIDGRVKIPSDDSVYIRKITLELEELSDEIEPNRHDHIRLSEV